MDLLLRLSARELARRIRAGECSAARVVERHVERIQSVNPRLDALVAERFELARLEAKRADERIAAASGGDLPPLLGVPCTIKENLAVTGMPQTAGLVSRSGVTAAEDATVVERLRAAGAVVLGVSNLSEATLWPGCFNRVYGQTRNAHASDRTPGGSSGGEGALVGAGASPFGIGTDAGGSVRIPAFCNGVFGHKPSGGLVPGTGQYPAYGPGTGRINTTGPLTRRAEDLMPLLRILAGPDGRDPACSEIPLGDPDAVDLAGLRVTVIDEPGSSPAPELRFAVHRAAWTLLRRGARVEMWTHPELRRGLKLAWALIQERGGLALDAILGDGKPIAVVRELLRSAVGRSDHTQPVLWMTLAAKALGLRRAPLERWARLAHELRAAFGERLGADGICLLPSARSTAPRAGHPLREMRSFAYCGLFNAFELPVTQVPMGPGEAGLPLGVQVVGGHGRDHLTIAVARELERAHGGWTPPEAG